MTSQTTTSLKTKATGALIAVGFITMAVEPTSENAFVVPLLGVGLLAVAGVINSKFLMETVREYGRDQ